MFPFESQNKHGAFPAASTDETFLCLNSGGPWTPLAYEKNHLRSEITSPLTLDSFGVAWPVMSQLAASPFNDRANAFSFASNMSGTPGTPPNVNLAAQAAFNQVLPDNRLHLLDPPPHLRMRNVLREQVLMPTASPPTSVSGHSHTGSSSVESCSSECPSPTPHDDMVDPDLLELRQMLNASKERAVPPSSYVCHSCGQAANHYIADCYKRKQQQSSADAKTPYQGPNESFGQLRCERPTCGHRWTSTRCFANQPQNCKKCSFPVYPHKMFSLQKAIAKGLLTADASTASPSHAPLPGSGVFHY